MGPLWRFAPSRNAQAHPTAFTLGRTAGIVTGVREVVVHAPRLVALFRNMGGGPPSVGGAIALVHSVELSTAATAVAARFSGGLASVTGNLFGPQAI